MKLKTTCTTSGSFLSARLLCAVGVLSCILFSCLMISCKGPTDSGGPQAVDYGPEVDVKDVGNAIANTYRDSDPTQTKVGSFVHFETDDDVGDGTLQLLTGDTSQTITNRVEDAQSITFDILETQVKYNQNNNTSSTVTRGYQIPFQKSAVAARQMASAQSLEGVRKLYSHRVGLALQAALRAPAAGAGAQPSIDPASPFAQPAPTAAPTPGSSPAPGPTPGPTPDGEVKITFHHLRTWEDSGPVPPGVQARAACLGIPGCKLTTRHVNFDIVFWNIPGGDRTHVELTTSPQIPQLSGFEMAAVQPYIPGLLKSCVTQLIPLNDGHTVSTTLITECQKVDDFLFAAP